jgi:uncharacterized membrane protein
VFNTNTAKSIIARTHAPSIFAVPIMHLLLYIAIVLDIPVFRQIIVFFYLSFVPGFVILKILRVEKTEFAEIILLSAGLSIAFTMLFGLLINSLYLVGVSQPLSVISITISMSLVTLALFVVGLRHDLTKDSFLVRNRINGLKSLLQRSSIFVLLPVLGAIGALYVNIPILLVLMILISVLYALSLFSKRLVPSKLYPLMIFSISIALLFHVLLTSQYIIGFDANLEFYVFKLTQANGHWGFLNAVSNPLGTTQYDAMLSITLLPAIYSAMMNTGGDIVFKILYPFIFSMLAVTLYRVYAGQIGKSASLASVLFLISGIYSFYGLTPISLNRQIVAEFFLSLSLFILFNRNISINKRRLLWIVFGVAIVVSHYSITYIYLACVFFIYAISRIKGDSDHMLNGGMLIVLYIVSLSWYTLSVAPFSSLIQFFSLFVSKFQMDFFSQRARTTETFMSQPVSNFATLFSVAIFVIANLFIAIGLLLVFKPQKTRFDPKYRVLSILNAVVLVLCFALPHIAPSLDLSRFYGITLLVLAPFFALGFDAFLAFIHWSWCKMTNQTILRNKYAQIKTLLLCTLLICFLLTQTGFVNRITDASPIVRSLDLDRVMASSKSQVQTGIYGAYIPEQDVFSAVWLSSNTKGLRSTVYADERSRQHVLTSYGLMPNNSLPLTNTTTLTQGSFVYLSYSDVKNGLIYTATGQFNSSEISHLFEESNLIYSNGNGEILSSPR